MSRHQHPSRKDGIDPVTRARARRRALQAVYAWQMSGGEVGQVISQFAHELAHEIADLEYFEDLVRGVVKHRQELDEALQPYLDRTVEEVDPIERAVLRIAMWELVTGEVPPPVGMFWGAPKVPSPLPSRKLVLPVLSLATTTSG